MESVETGGDYLARLQKERAEEQARQRRVSQSGESPISRVVSSTPPEEPPPQGTSAVHPSHNSEAAAHDRSVTNSQPNADRA